MADVNGVVLAHRQGGDELSRTASGTSPYPLPLANRPLVHYAVDAMRACGIRDVAVVVAPDTREDVHGALGDGSAWGLRLHWVDRAEPSAGGALAAARDALGAGDLFVHRGDGILLDPLGTLGTASRSPGRDVAILLGRETEAEAGRALRVVGSARVPNGDSDLAPVLLLAGGAVEQAAALDVEGFAELAAALRARDVPVEVQRGARAWTYHGHVDALLEANRMVLDDLAPGASDADLEGARIEGRVWVHPTAVLDRATIRGPAVIGADAVIADTFVGPYTSIGQGVRLEGTEIEHSIVLAGASIRNVGKRLEGSLVGSQATVDRQFTLPAGLRLRVGRGAEVSLD
jgi:glucose-1-phosphate thymidylyltransferase